MPAGTHGRWVSQEFGQLLSQQATAGRPGVGTVRPKGHSETQPLRVASSGGAGRPSSTDLCVGQRQREASGVPGGKVGSEGSGTQAYGGLVAAGTLQSASVLIRSCWSICEGQVLHSLCCPPPSSQAPVTGTGGRGSLLEPLSLGRNAVRNGGPTQPKLH